MYFPIRLASFCLCAITVMSAVGDLSVDPVFTDSMVLQRDKPVMIRGTGDSGSSVQLSFAGQSKSTIANENGQWEVTLDALPASTTPATLTVSSGDSTMILKNIVVGDVWLCSGQSNMGFNLSKCHDGPAAVESATDTLLRVNNYRDSWRPCVGKTASQSSGVAYFFGRHLREMNPDVPVGIAVRALSGSPIECWVPVDSLKKVEFCSDAITRFHPDADEGRKWQEFSQAEQKWKKAVRNAGKGRKAAGRKPKFDGDAETEVLAGIYSGDNPGRLWRERLIPWVGYTISGVIWYQGERNTKAGDECAASYGTMLSTLITSWREAWGQGNFRFLVVQLPTFEKGSANWAVVQQMQATAVKGVANADYVDIRDLPPEGLHPANKRPVGERLAAKANQ